MNRTLDKYDTLSYTHIYVNMYMELNLMTCSLIIFGGNEQNTSHRGSPYIYYDILSVSYDMVYFDIFCCSYHLRII